MTLESQSAIQRVEEALAVAVEIGVPPEIGHCHAALARIAARLGEKATAAQQLAAAQRIFEELGMAFWAGRVGN